MNREHILVEIRRTTEQNGGQPPGKGRFTTMTGIRPTEWEKYWARWGDALTEAGFQPNEWQVPFSEEVLLGRLASEIRRFGRMPTGRELGIRRREDPTLPSPKVFQRVGSRRQLATKMAEFCRDQPELADVLAIVERLLSEPEHDPSELAESPAEADFGFVYLLRSGRNFKLGRTNSVGRRERELAIQLPERAVRVHEIRTDDPAGIEAYWHRRFADRRKNGEWFELTPADVSAFRRRKFM